MIQYGSMQMFLKLCVGLYCSHEINIKCSKRARVIHSIVL